MSYYIGLQDRADHFQVYAETHSHCQRGYLWESYHFGGQKVKFSINELDGLT